MSKPQELIKPKLTNYLQATWQTRWLVIFTIAGSFFFLPNLNRTRITALLVAATIYNIFLWLVRHTNLAIVTNRLLTIVVDSVLTFILVALTGGTASPYLAILSLIMMSASYWYGALVSITVGLLQLIAIEVYYVFQSGYHQLPWSFVVKMAIFIIMGIYVALLSKSELSERSELIALGTKSEKERQQLLALINNMDDAVLVVDNDGDIMLCNQAAQSLLGGQTDLRGRPAKDCLSFIDSKDEPVQVRIKRLSMPETKKDLRLRGRDGSYTPVALNIAPYIVDRQNHGSVLLIEDISQDKTIGREREEFIAVASHELRTPLTIAQGELSLLLSPSYTMENPEAVAMLNVALRSLQQLSHIINDLTNLSQVENRQLPVELETLEPAGLLKEFESDYADQVKTKGLQLIIKTGPESSVAPIVTSRYVVKEILTIFMTNAIKFTDHGSLTLALEKPGDKGAGVTFSLSDTGLGISHSDQKKIFEKFFQSEDYTVRQHGGTGLGLYIAKKLADRLTAKVWFESELGHGSKFYLWVPSYSHDKSDQAKVASAETKDFFNGI